MLPGEGGMSADGKHSREQQADIRQAALGRHKVMSGRKLKLCVRGCGLLTVVGEHVVELYDEVIIPVKPFEADVRRGVYVREVLVQLHL